MATGGGKNQETVSVEGHRLRLTNLDKVLYPETETTKADVIAYYAAVAQYMLPHSRNRAATRKRWVHGVGTPEHPGQVFFQKNIEDSAPSWVKRFSIEHKTSTNTYPLVNDLATLTWLAQSAALEIHVPQWQFGPRGKIGNADRMVLDLDPGEGAGLAECAEVARLARAILSDMGLDARPVTSGSKGIHLYAALDGSQSSDDINAVAHELARALEADHPDLVVSDMKKTRRVGKVLVDWSQNNGNKTTICPYSLRGRFTPTVAAPRTWKELEDPDLAQLDYLQVMDRVHNGSDPLAGMESGAFEEESLEQATEESGGASDGVRSAGGGVDRLTKYRSMRDAAKTPEPVPEEPSTPSEGNSFVIQEHHARRLHWDFRLEHDGVLVSWALPKGPPATSGKNNLAVQTEDHPLDYGKFEGHIPKGEYGGGDVTIWDHGTYEREKWRDGKEVIAVLHGQPDGGLAREGAADRRYALIHTGSGGDKANNNWLIHLMKSQPKPGEKGKPEAPADGSADAPADAPAAPADTPADAPESPTRSVAAAARTRPATAAAPAKTSSVDVGKVARDAADASVPAVEPMMATLGSRAEINDDDEWAFEMKWDGVRAVVTVTPEGTRLISRNGNDMTAAYPELQDLSAHLNGERAVLDAEIVALNKAGRPDFGLLQPRMHLTKPREIAAAAGRTPVHLMVFDLLWLDGNSLADLTYEQRREILEQAVEPVPDGHLQVPPALDMSMDEAVAASKELGLEGVMAKRRSSTYSPGRRSKNWVKLKNQLTQEVVVVGWRPGQGNRQNKVGSLLVAVPDGVDLKYIGRVGSGLSEKDLATIGPRLKKMSRKTAPLDDVPSADASDAQWVRPALVGEVTFSERTGTGKLRHPVWRGLRPDKKPSDVVVETA
ncbi:ATP-dependent DNA ligase [Arthrobacter sp. zg-Y895]|uniref:ATP-dependent DNA ligase n=1 Tax=Arthrobacter sp. zg-Y895 TaxID=2886933 RepID=UPI001D145228|nr:ATP-dependent DNA ligase [Arthrobacter sp. zg-Y895]MCC3300971.1 ATP-dependent DNA ligase [Arthrobacter sp. zg-Y895]